MKSIEHPCVRRGATASWLAITAVVVLMTAPALAAGTPDQKCRAAKLKAAGKYASSLLGCAAKGAADGVATDPACVTKGDTKFTDSFASAESKNAVDCNGLDATTETIVVDAAAAAEAAAPVASGGGKCPSGVRKAAGKFASSVLGAWSKFVSSADAAKRDEAIGKARTTLSGKIAKSEAEAGCAAAGQGEAVRAAVEDGLAPLFGCLGSADACVENVEEVPAGGSSTTDTGSGASETAPMVAEVETPNAGTVVLRVIDTTSEPPSGFFLLGREVDITAPPASAAAPLVLTFVIDASLVPAEPDLVELMRNGVVVADCTGAPGVADPDPCVVSRTVLGNGDLEIVALTSQASYWTPMAPVPVGCPTMMRLEVQADTVGNDKASEIDIGWRGHAHDIDPVSGSAIRLGLDCNAASVLECGVCEITGFDPSENNCRCANAPRTACNEPSVADADDCGGSVCRCYTKPPAPSISGGTSVCYVSYAAGDAAGTWDFEAGAGDIVLNEKLQIFLANEVFTRPCPVCNGDTTPNDGVRDGTCEGGDFDGQTCDANGSDPTFPIPGGGWTSLDCFPNGASNINGLGIAISKTETTGTSSIPAAVPCAGSVVPGAMCPCAVCSGNASVACSSDAECSVVAAGTCSSYSTGVVVQPDECDNGTCVVDGNSEGECDSPLDSSMYCDGVVEEDGRGFLSCFDDSDCALNSAGNCTLLEFHNCFGASVSASGIADPSSPRTVATGCVLPATSSAVNASYGLPGPVRLRTDWNATYGMP